MSKQAVGAATLQCSFGTTTGNLLVIATHGVLCAHQPAATIMDYAPMTNISPFGMCQSLSNPQVASATSAAQGVLTPQPCVPATSAPWITGSPSVLIGYNPALNDTSTLLCAYGGTITITDAGETSTDIP